MTDTEYRILGIINYVPEITQREISVHANISLGKTNNLINSLIDNEYITTRKSGKGVIYCLTEKGIQALENELRDLFRVRINLHETGYKKIRQAVILANDNIKEFDKPTGLLDIEDTTMIGRIVKILRQNDIDNIIIVAGYKSDYYHELKSNENILIVENTKYKFTGSMASLTLVKDYIYDDFIIVDSNIIFEERALVEVLNSKQRDCMFVASETGSGEEIFVNIENGSIAKIQKDISALRRVDGELVGITKVSFDMYLRMLKQYEDSQNSYLSYKNQLFNLSMSYKVGYVKIEDLEWYKISNTFHYKKVLNIIYSQIKRKELALEIENIKKIIIDELNIDEDDINDIIPVSRLTKRVYRFYINETPYVLRIPFSETADLINREHEELNSSWATLIDINVNISYFNKNTGVKISEAIQNAKYLKPSMVKREKYMKLVADLMRKLHNSNIEMINEFNPFQLIEFYENLIVKEGGRFYEGYGMIKDNILKLKEKLQNFIIKLVPCHNVPIPENFIESDANKMYLIDWEFSGLNDSLWDVASFCLASGFNEEEEECFLELYFYDNVEECHKKRFLIYKVLHDFLWALWIRFRETKGDKFGTLGDDCFTRAKDNINIIFKGEIIP